MRTSLTILLLALAISAWSQTAKINRLKQALPTLHGMERVDCLNDLGWEFMFYHGGKPLL
jgi:hypothetical protein